MRVPITKGSTGLNTEVDSVRLPYDDNIGLVDLAACSNIDISNEGQASRRKPIKRIFPYGSHSLFPVGSKYCLFVYDGSLYGMLPDLTNYILITSLYSNSWLSYELLDGIVYYTSVIENGKIKIDTNLVSTWLNPAVYISTNKNRTFYNPPKGKFIAYFNGRFYIVDGKVIWYSDPYAPDIFSFGDSFLSFESNIQMIVPVDEGLYISDEYAVWFLGGEGPGKGFNWIQKTDYPALPYSGKKCNGRIRVDQEGNRYFVGGEEMAAVWLSKRGLCFGDSNGSFHNLTDEKIDMPGNCTTGACLVNKTTIIGQFN